MKLPTSLSDISSAYKAAATLVELATQEAKTDSDARDEKETLELGTAWGQGATGRGMATGGSKALKELEKEQKSRATRMVRDRLDGALLDLATFYRDVMMAQVGLTDAFINPDLNSQIMQFAKASKPEKNLQKINAIMQARTNLGYNSAPLLTIEALMCALA
jgi:DNA polymerase-3 subunit delta'